MRSELTRQIEALQSELTGEKRGREKESAAAQSALALTNAELTHVQVAKSALTNLCRLVADLVPTCC
jgi:hypothetical protein